MKHGLPNRMPQRALASSGAERNVMSYGHATLIQPGRTMRCRFLCAGSSGQYVFFHPWYC
jgi:hypothetical protein